MSRRKLVPYLLTLPGALWLAVFFLVPMVTMLSVSLQEGSLEKGYVFTGHWQTYTDALGKFDTQLIRSLWYGLVVTIVTLLVSYPMAYWIALRGGRRKNLYLLLILLPFFTPFIIRTLSWKFILADEGIFLGALKDWGLLGDSYQVLATSTAVVAGMIYNFLPFMALPLYVSLERLDPALLDAASDLYSTRRAAFFKVTLPLSLPGVFAGSLLTFIPATGDFVNATFLGGVNTTMIGNVIQREFLTNNDYPEGAAISFLLMAGILLGVWAYVRALGTEELSV
ncbi:MAG TPA: ABC transporter permease [Actinomycetota bacterium]|nr:ABC transporter permease [Actinomycetota bacterium]